MVSAELWSVSTLARTLATVGGCVRNPHLLSRSRFVEEGSIHNGRQRVQRHVVDRLAYELSYVVEPVQHGEDSGGSGLRIDAVI